MNTAGLNFDNIPALSTPLGFIRTAPWFGILAALLILFFPDTLTARAQPQTLALVHLLTLGVAGHIMLGALFQVMPVVSSRAIAVKPYQLLFIRSGLTLGTLLLSAFFLFTTPWLALAALLLLLLSAGLFIKQLSQALWQARPAGISVQAIRLAAVGLLITLIAGILLLWWRASPATAPLFWLNANQHAGWGVIGWGLLLVMGVSFQVIPMFHVAPDFPCQSSRWLPRGLFAALLLATLFNSLPNELLPKSASSIMLSLAQLIAAGYCLQALWILSQRKRKLVDYTVRCWQLALVSITAAMLLLLLQALLPSLSFNNADQLVAVLAGFAGLMTVMIGMLQKIIPFLIYLHLQRRCLSHPEQLQQLPNMKQIIPSRRSQIQWRLHLTTVLALMMALYLPDLSPLAGLLLLADFIWLGWTLEQAQRLWKQCLSQ